MPNCQILVFHLVVGQITRAFEALFPHLLKMKLHNKVMKVKGVNVVPGAVSAGSQ